MGWTVQNADSGENLADRRLTTQEVMSVVGSAFWIADFEDEKAQAKGRMKARAKDFKQVLIFPVKLVLLHSARCARKKLVILLHFSVLIPLLEQTLSLPVTGRGDSP